MAKQHKTIAVGVENNSNSDWKAYANSVGFFYEMSTLGKSMAGKRAIKAALSANYGLEAYPIFMTICQSIGLLSLIFSLPF